MAASLSVSATRVGQPVTITGSGFAVSTPVTLTVSGLPYLSLSAIINSDPAGAWSTTDIAAHASATLTLTGNAVAAETVGLAGTTYTWRATVGSTANEVFIGATAAASIVNLVAAVTAGTGSGTLYGSATVVNANAGVYSSSATNIIFYALAGGTGGNALASTETMTNASFGGATFSGGTAASGEVFNFTPSIPAKYTFSATDGTSTASATAQLFSSP